VPTPVLTNAYITLDQLKAALGDKRPTPNPWDDAYAMAIESSSRQIDQYCDDQFWNSGVPSVRVFRPEKPRGLEVGSFASVTGLSVAVDMDDDGVYETPWVLGTDYQVFPYNPTPGWPYRRIEPLGARFFPGAPQPYLWQAYGYTPGFYGPAYGNGYIWRSKRPRVQVTANWGWAAPPPQVIQACQILSIESWKSKDLTNGVAGSTGISTGSFGPQRGMTMAPSLMNPVALQLLCGLRDIVVA